MGDVCVEWQGRKDKAGYGRTKYKGKSKPAHRAIWMRAYGELPRHILVRHKCDNPSCVNLAHLEIGTAADNMRDRDERGRNGNKNKTHCKHGHEFNEKNTYVRANGARKCKVCHAKREKERKRRRRKSPPPDGQEVG